MKKMLYLILAVTMLSILCVENVFATEYVMEYNSVENAYTSNTTWYTDAKKQNEFNPSIEIKDNESVLSVKKEVSQTAPENHQMVYYKFADNGVGENGLIHFSYKLYVPSGSYNSTKPISYTALLGTGDMDILTWYFQPNNGKVNIKHMPQNADGSEGGQTVFSLKQDCWITFDTILNAKDKTYTYTVTDGTTVVKSETEYYWRNRSNTEIGMPYSVRTYIQKNQTGNALYYIKDACVGTYTEEEARRADLNLIPTFDTVYTDVTLPVLGTKFGNAISWESSNTDVIMIDENVGKVTIPENNTQVTLTAKIGDTSKDFTVNVVGKAIADEKRLEAITASLDIKSMIGQSYINKDIVPYIENLKPTDTLEITSSNENIVKFQDGKLKIMNSEFSSDYVTLTVKISAGNVSKEKSLNARVISGGCTMLYENFDYPSLIDKSISGADNWTVENENTDLSSTGSISLIKEIDGDTVLNIHQMRKYDKNQYPKLTCSLTIPEKITIGQRIKLSSATNRQNIIYVRGNVIQANGDIKSNVPIINLFINPKYYSAEVMRVPTADNSKTSEALKISDTDVPVTDKWVDVLFEMDNTTLTYNFYVDGKKINAEPLSYNFKATNPEWKISTITTLYYGAQRAINVENDMYIKDIFISADAENILPSELNGISIPTDNVMFDLNLPTSGNFDGTEIEWTSSDTSLIENDGRVKRIAEGMEKKTVTLTATVSVFGKSESKQFEVNVVDNPPYTIDKINFETSDGNSTMTPVANGKLKNIIVSKNTQSTDNVNLIVGLYKDGKLLSLMPIKEINATGTYEYDVKLPDVADVDVKAFIWKQKDVFPLSYNVGTQKSGAVKILMCGDSTMETTSDKNDDITKRQTGWGQVLNQFFDEEYVTVSNHAKGGRSTKSFFDEGRLQNVIDEMNSGDYMIMGFGHNDQKTGEPANYASIADYKKNLAKYVNAARSKGVQPVICTSINRHLFKDGVPTTSLEGYPDAAREVAEELNVPLIDLEKLTREWLTNLGNEASAEYFMVSVNGTDNTHLRYTGALEIAKMATKEMKRLGLPIVKYLKSE